jgi:NADH-quinone oxidoreductase subunit N
MYFDLLKSVAPETIVAVTAFVLLAIDLGVSRKCSMACRQNLAAILATVGCIASAIWLGWTADVPVRSDVAFAATSSLPQLAVVLKIILLLLTVFVAWLSIDSNFTTHTGEFFALLLFATVAMMFLVSAENLLMIFVSLEFLSLCLYTMAAFNKQSLRSAEAALKYFLFGGMSAAFLLLGFSYVYGLTGELDLHGIARVLTARGTDPLLVIALIMIAAGFGFKIAAVPFHLWAPDAYQGAPGPVAAFIASGSKVASFFILAKVLSAAFASAAGTAAWRSFTTGWLPLLALLAAASVIVGNVAAIAQSSVRRLLAYSAVAHAGYALIGVLAFGEHRLSALLYYVITYAFTVLGAFGIVAVLEQRTGHDGFAAFAGLSKRAPVLSFCMLIFMLSLAGIPPLAGFFGKFYVFAAALSNGKDLALLWLVILAIAMSAVSLYYYLQVLKQIYVLPGDTTPLRAPWPTQLVIVLMAVAVLALGLAPTLLLKTLTPAVSGLAGIR